MNFTDILLLIGKTIFSYIFLLIILKIMGKRELSQISVFDVVIFLIVSELFSLSLNDPKSSLLHFVIPVLVIVILEISSAWLSMKSIKIRNLLEGKAVFLIYDGKVDYEAMKKNHYNIGDLMIQLRNKDIQSINEVAYAVLESNGNLNVISKKKVIVAYPDPLIMDGKVNNDALKKMKISEDTLIGQITKEGYTSIEDIFFAQLLIDGLYIISFKDLMNS